MLPSASPITHSAPPVRSVTLLGATGSIGASTIDLLLRDREHYRVEAVTAARNATDLARIAKADRSAVFLDARGAEDFANGTIAGAQIVPVDDVISGKLAKIFLPEDDFNRRIVLFGRDAAQARTLAEVLSKRPWHNVMYYAGTYDALAAELK